MERVTLGSASPRRLELLKKLGLEIDIKPPHIKEEIDNSLSLKENAIKLSLDKLKEVKKNNPEDSCIITADTFIAFNNKILGKPINRDDAFNMLSLLSGEEHRVITGYSVYLKKNNITIADADITRVKFKTLDVKNINNYLAFNEWEDAAGAYKIQGLGEILIEKINGSFSSVMGLPISRIYGILIAQKFINPVI